MKKLIPTLLVGALIPPLASFSYAQDDDSDADVFELSPFVVDASDNEGYYATSTLAGTRIKSDLKDIGTSIQVITKEFMDDIGANDAQDLLLYTTNTEIGGIQGNWSGEDTSGVTVNTEASRDNPFNSTRIRGIQKTTVTRNYFETIIPFDSYNTGRVGINRGSNSILFGLGSPAGIINNTVEGAVWKNGGEVKMNVDHEGSFRTSLNLNQVILEDKLAVRAAFLSDNRKYHQEPTYQDVERGYGAFNWRITDSTTLRGNFEKGHIRANRPDSMSPIENITPWMLSGKPTVNTGLATGKGWPAGTPTGIKVDKDGDGVLDDVYGNDLRAYDDNVYMQYPDGSFVFDGQWGWHNDGYVTAPKMPSPIPGSTKGDMNPIVQSHGFFFMIWGDPRRNEVTMPGFFADHENATAGDALSYYLGGNGNSNEDINFRGTENYKSYFNEPYTAQGYTDLKGYNWGKYMLAGNAPIQTEDFEAYNLALEQTFFDKKVGFELSYDFQDSYRTSFTPLTHSNTALFVDINQRVPDGRENPNYGRPYVMPRNGKRYWNTDYSTFRATAYIKHDFAEQFEEGLGRWLGRHSITGLIDRNEKNHLSFGSGQVYDSEYARRYGGSPNELGVFQSQIRHALYVGPSVLGSEVSSLNDVTITPNRATDLWMVGENMPVIYYDPGAIAEGVIASEPEDMLALGRMIETNLPVVESFGTGGDFTKTILDSKAAVWQGMFLRDHLVATIGYREDSVDLESYTLPPADERLEGDPWAHPSLWGNMKPDETTADRWSYSYVAHVPQKFTPFWGTRLSFHYATSSNFALEPGRVNWNNVPIPNPSGETEERGFAISTLDDKLHIRVNWYETSLMNKSSLKPSNFVWNNILQSSKAHANKYFKEKNAAWADFYLASYEAIQGMLLPGERERFDLQEVYTNNKLSSYLYNTLSAESDVEDAVSEGTEIEITWNITRNWRMHANIARQQTLKYNFHKYSEELLELRVDQLATPLRAPYSMFTIGDLTKGGLNKSIVDMDASLATGQAVYLKNYSNNYDFLRTRLTNYLTAKAAEGAPQPEVREWRFNLVTNYSFKDGRLEGLNVGAAYRWQDEVGIGYELMPISDPQWGEVFVGDVENPYMAGSEDAWDFFCSYQLPWLKKYGRWTVGARVRNAFSGSMDVIPVKVQPDGETIARVRLAPQQLWSFYSTFRW